MTYRIINLVAVVLQEVILMVVGRSSVDTKKHIIYRGIKLLGSKLAHSLVLDP